MISLKFSRERYTMLATTVLPLLLISCGPDRASDSADRTLENRSIKPVIASKHENNGRLAVAKELQEQNPCGGRLLSNNELERLIPSSVFRDAGGLESDHDAVGKVEVRSRGKVLFSYDYSFSNGYVIYTRLNGSVSKFQLGQNEKGYFILSYKDVNPAYVPGMARIPICQQIQINHKGD